MGSGSFTWLDTSDLNWKTVSILGWVFLEEYRSMNHAAQR